MRYRVLEQVGERRKFVLVLDAGEEVVTAVTHFAARMNVKGASLTGIGALSRARLGHFDPATKEFTANDIAQQTEVLSILGNIAEADAPDDDDGDAPGEGGVRLHIHIVLGCRDASAKGGHLVEGHVAPTMELIVEEAESHLTRGLDAETGLVLLEPRHPCPHHLPCPAAAPARKVAS